MKNTSKFITTVLIIAVITAFIPASPAFAEDDPPLLISTLLIAPAPAKSVSLAPQYATSAVSSLTALTLRLDSEGYDLKYYGVSDYKTQLKNGTLLWVSSDSTVASVDQKGVVKPVSEGTCEISLQVGTGEYTCIPVVVTVIDPSKPAVSTTPVVTPATEPSVKPSTEPSATPTVLPVSDDGSVLVYKIEDSAYKRSLEVVDTLTYSGSRPATEAEWTNVIVTLFRIKIYDPCNKKTYTIDKDNPIPENWSVIAIRYHEGSDLLKSIGVMVPYNSAYTYLEFPVEMPINFR